MSPATAVRSIPYLRRIYSCLVKLGSQKSFYIYAALHAASLALTQVLVVPPQLLVDDTLLLQLLLQLLYLLLHGCNMSERIQMKKAND